MLRWFKHWQEKYQSQMLWKRVVNCYTNQPKDLEKVFKLLQKGANPNTLNILNLRMRGTSYADTPISLLMFACIIRHQDLARMLLEHGANPNFKDIYKGNTALAFCGMYEIIWEYIGFCEVEGENLPMAKILVEYGADPQLKNHAGRTVYDFLDFDDVGDWKRVLEKAQISYQRQLLSDAIPETPTPITRPVKRL